MGPQTVREGTKFGIKVNRSLNGKAQPGITVTNYERLHYFNPSDFSGVVADESSAIKCFTAQRQKSVTQFMEGVEFRLLCTATAAPNDYIELGTSSEALGYLGRMDMLGMFFKNDEGSLHPIWWGSKWRMKPHAELPFWRWVCSWARAIRRPSDLGYEDGRFVLPKLTVNQYTVDPPKGSYVGLFPPLAVTLADQRKERRNTIEQRCELVASLVDEPKCSVVWCHLNSEGDLLERIIPGAVQVKGSDRDEAKEERFMAFVDGQIKVLVTKPRIGCFGMNWQHCSDMTFFPSHCYDAETELLTADGWKTFGQVQVGDEVGTVSPETLFFEWQRVTDCVWSSYSGDMIQFAGRSYELLVTPNHRMWSRHDPARYPTSGGKWEVHTAEELASSWRRQHRNFQATASGWVGVGPDVVPIPYSEHVNNSHARTRHVGEIPADAFAALAGWYLSEGCVCTRDGVIDGRIVICQTDKHPENRERIISALKATGLPVNADTKDIAVHNKELAYFLAEQLGLRSANMHIPRWLKDWPADRLRIMWEAIMDGDGMHNSGRLRGLKSTSRRLIADCQEIGFKLGIATTDRSDAGNYLSIRSEYTHPAIVHQPERVPYSGMVGCVTVPNGLLVVRRSGHIIVSGNSFEQYYQGVRRCWRFGQNNPVTVSVVTSKGEQGVLKNLQRKEQAASKMFDNLVAEMNRAAAVDMVSNNGHAKELPKWLR